MPNTIHLNWSEAEHSTWWVNFAVQRTSLPSQPIHSGGTAGRQACDCGSPTVREGVCSFCPACGWSSCQG